MSDKFYIVEVFIGQDNGFAKVFCKNIEDDPLIGGNLKMINVTNISINILNGKFLSETWSIKKESIKCYYYGSFIENAVVKEDYSNEKSDREAAEPVNANNESYDWPV